MDDRTAAILDVVRGLPARRLAATIRNPRSSADRTFVGASLFDYAVKTRLFASKTGGGGLANGYFMITAEDGARAAVTLAELWPALTRKHLLLAYEQDGEPVRSGIRLVITGDHLSGRSLGGIVSIEPRRIERGPAVSRGPGGVALTGLLDRPGMVDAAVLRAYQAVEVTTVAATGHGGQSVAPRRYAGVRLYDVLDGAGIRLDPAVNEDFLSKVVAVTSADGDAVVIAGGEIEPRFMNGDVIVAAERAGGEPGDASSGLRLVLPFDRKPRRWAKALVSIELREG